MNIPTRGFHTAIVPLTVYVQTTPSVSVPETNA